MKIEVLDVNNSISYYNTSKVIWNRSRPKEKLDEIDGKMVNKLDLPVNEFSSAILFIESTILEREIITSMRNHVMWAQTSRVQNILDFEYPNWIKNKEVFEQTRSRMKYISTTERQDDYRMALPLMSLTKYSIKISARDLIHLHNYFVYLFTKFSLTHFNEMLSSAIEKFREVLKVLGYQDYKSYPDFKTPQILKPILDYASGRIGNTITVSARITISLRAQLVRHRNLLVRDNLLSMMLESSFVYSAIGDEIDVQISGLIEDISDVISKRSCWIAQYNLWSPLINEIEKIIELGEKVLPCKDGVCPFAKDAELRLTNKDPNAPCPIHAKLNKIKINETQKMKMREQKVLDLRPSFWDREIKDC